jgi:hypothetical protein
MLNLQLKGTVSRDFLLLVFYESVCPQPQSIPLGPFRIFSKNRGDIRKSRCTTGINDTGGKFANGVNETCGKLATGIKDTSGNLPPVSATPAANFATSFAGVVVTGGKFATGVNDTGGKICHRCQISGTILGC